MSFFILTGAILLGTIFAVHFAANSMGFRLFYSSLFLSAVLALSINLIVISMKDVTSPLSIAKLLLAVLISSAFVTVINDVLTRREKKKLLKEREEKQELKKNAKLKGTLESSSVNIEETQETLESDNANSEETQETLESTFTETSKDKNKTVGDSDAVNENEEAEETEDNEETEETEEKPGFFKRLFGGKKKDKEATSLDFSEFKDLDALLDFAYDARIDGRYNEAVAAYEGAIELYKDDPYLPFLFIDLANVHKNQGEYTAAIDVYEKAINMENIRKNADTLASFENNVNYLKSLKKVLRKRKMEHKHFNELDEDILKEVDSLSQT